MPSKQNNDYQILKNHPMYPISDISLITLFFVAGNTRYMLFYL